MSEFVEIAGLWTGEDKNGNPKMSGGSGKTNYHILKNTFKKEGSNEPDYRLFISQKPRPESNGGAGYSRPDQSDAARPF